MIRRLKYLDLLKALEENVTLKSFFRFLIVKVILLTLFSTIAYSQNFKQFSGKPENFTSEVLKFINTDLEDEPKLELDSFKIKWDSLKFEDAEKVKILNISRNLVDKKIRAYPDFYNFLVLNSIFISKNHPRESYNQWLDALVKYSETKKISISSLNKIIEHTLMVFKELLLYKSNSIIWKPQTNKFYYKFDSDLKLFVNECNLICYSKRDSVIIYKTTGYYTPLNNLWYGKNGEVTWERAGYDRNVVTSYLSEYQIDMSKSSYEADSVIFQNKVYFHEPLLGKLQESVTNIINAESATYPRFNSYKQEFELKNLYPNVDYKGGFSMQGAKFIGKGTLETPAELRFYRHDTLRLKAHSQYFIIRPDRIKGLDASVAIFLEKDSIYHGDLQFTYTSKNNEISLLKSDNYSSQSPYVNSYHKIDMNFEQLIWRIDEPMLLLTTTPGSSQGKALFESENYFNSKEYEESQYYYDIHPLISLKRFAAKEGNSKFSAEDFAVYMRTSIDNLRTLLFPLAVKGFIFYDPSIETIEVKKRLYENISASVGRIDYDVLRFYSRTNAPLENASLDLRNNDLKVHGIPQVFVSDSQNVTIYPKNQSITLKQNRNFQFDGVVVAGLFTFYGRNFFFNYDEFKIGLKDIDSIHLKVITGYDNYLKPIYQDVSSVIQDITGDILVDKPDNKSGIKSNPQYPIFNSRGYSYVYYDDKKIFNGVYERRKKFHFRLDSYELDSLDNFTKEGLNFSGIFSSAGILPDIPEKLTLQKDFSLGFKHTSPAQGYPVYGGKGTYKNLIHLSNQGLRGNGELTYLCSSANSQDFIFFPDSTNATAQTFAMQEKTNGIECPLVQGDTIKIHWEPYKDNLMAQNIKKPFMIFNKEVSHNGQLYLSPKGLAGSGVLDLTTATVRSNKFAYKHITIDADTSDFNLRSLNTQGYTVLTSNVKSHIDLAVKTGRFKSNNSQAITEFPENKYIAMLDEFLWKMNEKELEMISSRKVEASKDGESFGFKDAPLLGSKYISIKKDQDSLSFVSPQAVYDYENNLLNAKKVKYIDVADARIFPEKEQISVNPQGYINNLNNSKILANRQTRFHNIYNAQVYIKGKLNYEANGNYDYIDKNKKKETFRFTEIGVDTFGNTYADAIITEPDSFTLSPYFPYQGKINLYASNQYLRFNGATRILQNCPNYGSAWFLFDTTINPTEVKILITDEMTEINRKFIVSGTLITTDSIHIYSSFFGGRKNYSDSIVANATGILRYNEYNFSYEIASEGKLKNRDLPGNYMRLNTKTCQHYAEGIIRPGVNYGQFHHKSAGTVDHDLKSNQVKLNISIALDFFMYDKGMQLLAHLADSLGKSPVDLNQNKIKKNFITLVPEDVLIKYNEDIAANKVPGLIPDVFQKNIFIDDVSFVWDDVSNSYRSKGKIAIGYIAGKRIHKYFDGYMELWRKRSGDLFDLYIKIDENNYFYIAYTRGTLHITSSSLEFNNMIRELSNDKRTLKVKWGQMPYSFTMATERKLNNVRKRWLTGETDEAPESDDEMIPELPSEMGNDSIPMNSNDTIPGNIKRDSIPLNLPLRNDSIK